MTCRELADFIMAYLDHELPPAQRAEFDRHLAICPACVDYLDSYEQTIRAARSSADSEEAAVPEDLIKAILAARSAGR